MGLNIDALRRRLEETLAELEAAEEATRDRRAPVELDQTSVGRLSRMDAMQMQAMAAAQSLRRIETIARTRAAIDRVRNGTYGECQRCGEEVEEKRLDLDPATPFCLACASGR